MKLHSIVSIVIAVFLLSACSDEGVETVGDIASDASNKSNNIDEVSAASSSLHQLLDADWQRYMQDSPEMASYLGDKRYNSEWEDTSIAAINNRHEQGKKDSG